MSFLKLLYKHHKFFRKSGAKNASQFSFGLNGVTDCSPFQSWKRFSRFPFWYNQKGKTILSYYGNVGGRWQVFAFDGKEELQVTNTKQNNMAASGIANDDGIWMVMHSGKSLSRRITMLYSDMQAHTQHEEVSLDHLQLPIGDFNHASLAKLDNEFHLFFSVGQKGEHKSFHLRGNDFRNFETAEPLSFMGSKAFRIHSLSFQDKMALSWEEEGQIYFNLYHKGTWSNPKLVAKGMRPKISLIDDELYLSYERHGNPKSGNHAIVLCKLGAGTVNEIELANSNAYLSQASNLWQDGDQISFAFTILAAFSETIMTGTVSRDDFKKSFRN